MAFSSSKKDLSTGVDMGIDYAHHEIHGGSHYNCSKRSILNDTGTLDILITTPNTTKWGHMLFDITGSLDTDFELYEASTHTAGTALTCINKILIGKKK